MSRSRALHCKTCSCTDVCTNDEGDGWCRYQYIGRDEWCEFCLNDPENEGIDQ